MKCMCLQQLLDFLASLKNLPLNALMGLIPPVNVQPMTTLAAAAGNMTAMANASANLRAALGMGLPPVSMDLVAKMEAMAALQAATGVNALSANASAILSAVVGTINARLPSLLAPLMELLAPLLEALQDLLSMLNAANLMQMNLGFSPGVLPNVAPFLNASLSATLMANLGALQNIAAHARLAAAASALGFNLMAPGGVASLNAALSAAASLSVAPLTIPLPLLGGAIAALTPLTAAKMNFNINMLLPNALSLLKALIASLLPALNMNLNLTESLTTAATLSGIAPALNMNLSAFANLNLNAAIGLPSLGNLALTAHLAEQIQLLSGISVMSAACC